MALETGTYISDLVVTNPASGDLKSQGDDHLRLLKSTIKATFPNISGAVTPTHTVLNKVGVTQATTDNSTNPATTEFVQNVVLASSGVTAVLPAQSGNAGKYLKTNGTTATWQDITTLAAVTGTTQTATGGYHYSLINVAATTVTLPASPGNGEIVAVTSSNGLATNVIARNGNNINGLAQDLTIDVAYATAVLRFLTGTGWIIVDAQGGIPFSGAASFSSVEVTGPSTITANSASTALTITQDGAGNALEVRDVTGDTTPFAVNASGSMSLGATPVNGYSFWNGKSITGSTTCAGTINVGEIQSGVTTAVSMFLAQPSTQAAVFTLTNLRLYDTFQSTIGVGSAVTNQYGFYASASLIGAANNYGFYGGVPSGTGRYNLYMNGTADNYLAGSLGIGGVPFAGYKVLNYGTISGATTTYGFASQHTIDSSVTVQHIAYRSAPLTSAAAFTLGTLSHFLAAPQAAGAGSSITTQICFDSGAPTQATNNYGFMATNTAAVTAGKTSYGFYSAVNTASGGGTTWQMYLAGTAPSYIGGDLQLSKTVTAGGTTGAQTINKSIGTVNFAVAATSLVVTNSLVTANSIITATVGTNDATMKSVAVVAAAGSFTIYANAAATAETRVNFHVLN